MAESDIDIYNLNYNEINQSLKLSIINNKHISIILSNKETKQKYLALFSLPQLKEICKAFLITKTIYEALEFLKNTIESGRMLLSEESNGNYTNINLTMSDYPPFDIKLNLEKKNNHENTLSPKIDYREIKETEKKYGNTTENTTEYSENIKDNSNNFRSNSAARRNINYYSSKTSSNLKKIKKMSKNQANIVLNPNHHTNNQLGTFMNNNIYNNVNYKTISDYSTMTVQKKPFVIPHLNYGMKLPNPTLYNNNYTNSPRINDNNIIEQQRPRMFNQINGNRSSSTPHNQNINRFYTNKSPSMFQPNPTNNPFQTNQFYEQNQITNITIKTPYDRNTEKTIVKNKYSLNRESPDKTSNKIIMKNTNPNNNKFNQVKVNQNQIKQAQSYTNQTISYHHQQFRNLSSHKINQTKTQLFYQPQNTQFQIKASTPLPSQLTSIGDEKNDIYKQISHQQIALAQMASLQNQENPNFENLHVITLGKNPKIVEEISKQNDYQEINDNNIEEPQDQEENKGLNIEALFITEEGRVIFRNGLLRGIIHKYAEIDDVVSKIQDILLKGAKFHLVYKAFDLDDSAKTFHEKCDNLDMSLVLIETKKDIRFGGFTTKSWKGNCLKKKDNNAFVFNLETNKIYDIIQNEPAVGSYPKFGPVFFGCQIRIYDEFFSKGGSTCHRGLNYKTKKDFELNNGEQKYLVKDIEVYRIETIDID